MQILTAQKMIDILAKLPPKTELYILQKSESLKIFKPMTAGRDLVVAERAVYLGDDIVPEKFWSNAGTVYKAKEVGIKEEDLVSKIP